MSSGIKQVFQDEVTKIWLATEVAGTLLPEVAMRLNDQLGVVRQEDDGKAYRFVKNNESATDLEVGNVVCYNVANKGAALFKNVLIPATADLYLFAGVCVSAIPFQGAGWIQISGYNADCDVDEPGTTAIAIGSTISPANTLTYMETRVAAGTAPTYPGYVQALEAPGTTTPATASTTNMEVIIHAAPFI